MTAGSIGVQKRPWWRALLVGWLGLRGLALAAEPEPPRAPSILAPCGGPSGATLEVVLVAPDRASNTTLPASPLPLAALHRAVCDWFREDSWHVRFSSQPSLPDPTASRGLRLVIALTSPRTARLYADAPRGRWVHDVPLEAGLDDVGIEAVAEALHSAAQAATAEAIPPRPRSERPVDANTPRSDALMARPDAEPAPPEPAPREPDRATATSERAPPPRTLVEGSGLPVHTALGYQAYARGEEPLMHGPALHLELDALSWAVTLGTYFRASLFSSGTRRTIGFDVRTSGASLSLGAAASVPVAGLTARTGIAGGLDLIALAVRVADPGLVRQLPHESASLRPFVGGEVGLLLIETRYQLLTSAGPMTLFRPWQLQPGGMLALGYVW
jgi:hypothetical protein